MKLTYCPQCAAPLAMQTKTEYICDNKHTYWNNPRATVTIILIKNDKFLVSTRGSEPFKDKYDTPGGFLEYFESPQQAAKREMLEETGLVIDDLQLLGGYFHEYEENVSTCDFVFVAHKWKGKMKPHDDVAALAWKPISVIDGPDFAWHYPGLVAKLSSHD